MAVTIRVVSSPAIPTIRAKASSAKEEQGKIVLRANALLTKSINAA
jgi:hypothetical protein